MAIDKLIAEAAARIETDSAAALLRRGLTLDARLPEDDALDALSSAERHLAERISAGECPLSRCIGNVSLAFRPHGRLYLMPRKEFEAHATALALLGHAELAWDDVHTYYALRLSAQAALENDRADICADLEAQGFERVCAEIASAAEHMAPLVYYVGERCVSNFYSVGKSGFPREITLAQALQQVSEGRERADIEPLTAVHCVHLLLRSGGYTRLEELNSTQLSRRTLAGFFAAKRAFYERDCGCPAEAGFAGASFREEAASLARMREAIAGRSRFIRLITGPNLRKREGVLPLPPVSPYDVAAPITRSANVLATLQRCLPTGTCAKTLFRPENFEHLLGKALLPEGERSTFDSGLEYLLDRVVAEAVRSTNSDIGMTRGTRDFRRFAQALQRRDTALASGWSQSEYFCHVVPSQTLRRALPPKAVHATLNAISARMRFNSWHYAPSYFNLADVPASRGWFTAPRLADIADDSDQHHAGHVHAAVRYSIRSPLPVRAGKELLLGFIDLRLMRQSGAPYTREDLVTAIAYTEVLQFLYQHLMNHVLERGASFVFSFGDKKWFDRTYLPQPAPAPQPPAVAQPMPLPQQPLPAALHA